MKSRQPLELKELLSTDPGQNIILRTLDVKDYNRLAQTSYSMSQFFKSPIFLSKLARYLAQSPDDVKVQSILNNNLNFLDVVFKEVVLKSRTVINVTPLQLVFGAGDREMCGTLAPFFEEKYGSKEAGINEMQRQISEIKNNHQPFDFKPIIQAISNELFNLGKDAATGKWILNPATLAAIKKFREDFDASQPKTINKGMHFRWETLSEFSDAYAEATVLWGYNYYKSALLEDAALSWVLNYIPENSAQHFSQGLYHLQKDNPEPLKRMQKTRDGEKFYEVLKQPSVDFLLDGSCANIIMGRCRMLRSLDDWVFLYGGSAAIAMRTGIAKFLSGKDFKLAELMQPKPIREAAQCVIF